VSKEKKTLESRRKRTPSIEKSHVKANAQDPSSTRQTRRPATYEKNESEMQIAGSYHGHPKKTKKGVKVENPEEKGGLMAKKEKITRKT